MRRKATCSEDDFPDGKSAVEHATLVEGFAVFNPHLTITLDWFGKRPTWKATDPAWQKWRPNQPTSIHRYELPHLERLIGADVTHDRDRGSERLASDLIAEFEGLSGSRKRSLVLDETGLRRVSLAEFSLNGHLDHARIDTLRSVMQKHTRPVKSKRLGAASSIRSTSTPELMLNGRRSPTVNATKRCSTSRRRDSSRC